VRAQSRLWRRALDAALQMAARRGWRARSGLGMTEVGSIGGQRTRGLAAGDCGLLLPNMQAHRRRGQRR
jgi:hypothetical protein